MNSVKNILSHLLDFKEPIDMIGSIPDDRDLLKGFMDQLHRLRIKRKIFLRVISNLENIKTIRELNKLDFTESKYLALDNSGVCKVLSGKRVIIFVWSHPIEVIIIESAPVVNFFKEEFEILLGKAQTPEQIMVSE
jgi:hypothetical protein